MLAKLSRLQERLLCDRLRLAECQRACDVEEAYASSVRDELEAAQERSLLRFWIPESPLQVGK